MSGAVNAFDVARDASYYDRLWQRDVERARAQEAERLLSAWLRFQRARQGSE